MTYAGFWRRFTAFILDVLILSLISCLLIIPFFLTPLWFVVTFLYYPVFNSSPLKGTPGKHIMGIVVTRIDGTRLDFKTAIIRHLMSMISGSFFFLGYFMYFFTDRKQTLHDYVADTIVVPEIQDSTNVFKIWLDQMKDLLNLNNTVTTTSPKQPIVVGPNAKQSLEDLYDLYKKGILSEEEYNRKKEEYLRKL